MRRVRRYLNIRQRARRGLCVCRRMFVLPGPPGLHVLLVLIMTVPAFAIGGCRTREGSGEAHVAEGSAAREGVYGGLPLELQQELERSHQDSPEERLHAVRDFVQRGGISVLPRLVEMLDDADSRVRCEAAQAIGSLGSEARSAARDVSPLASDRSAMVRQCAALALASLGGDTALETLLDLLSTAPESHHDDAVDALGRLGRIEAVPAIVPYLESSSQTTVENAARALARIGPGAVPAVRELLDSDAPNARCAATGILATWESDEDQRQVRRMSRHDSDPQVRLCALGALGRLGDEAAVERLAELVGSDDREQAAGAAEALGVVGTASAVRALIRALTAFHDQGNQNAAQAALLTVGASARGALEDALPAGPPLRRALVAETLGLLGEPDAVSSLERAAMDTDALVREAAENALSILRDR